MLQLEHMGILRQILMWILVVQLRCESYKHGVIEEVSMENHITLFPVGLDIY